MPLAIARFTRQLRWELIKLWARPRTYLGFAASLLFEIVLVTLYRTTPLGETIDRAYWRVPAGLTGAVSGLTAATHVAAETMAIMTSLFLALVAGDIVATEHEERTLHMILTRPVTRESVLLQKLVTCAVYTLLLSLFVGVTSLVLALVVDGRGTLVMISARESIVGIHGFAAGLRRYALAIAILGPCWLSFTLLAFALSCWRVKPGAAIVAALAILLGDELLRVQPGFAAVAPYCLTTRLLTWRQVLADHVSWLRIERNLSELLFLDVALIAAAWWVFRRRELAP